MNDRAKKVGVAIAVIPWSLIVAAAYSALKKNDVKNPMSWILGGIAVLAVPTVIYINSDADNSVYDN